MESCNLAGTCTLVSRRRILRNVLCEFLPGKLVKNSRGVCGTPLGYYSVVGLNDQSTTPTLFMLHLQYLIPSSHIKSCLCFSSHHHPPSRMLLNATSAPIPIIHRQPLWLPFPSLRPVRLSSSLNSRIPSQALRPPRSLRPYKCNPGLSPTVVLNVNPPVSSSSAVVSHQVSFTFPDL